MSDTRYVSFDDVDYMSRNEIDGFEDMAWLFNCSPGNRKIIRMDFDEAAYLYRVTKSLGDCNCLEIGRWQGGSTFLLAAATTPKSRIISIDKLDKIPKQKDGKIVTLVTESLVKAMLHFGLDSKVNIIVDESTNISAIPNMYDLIFIDGDHKYSGVLADFNHWARSLKIGGYLLLHDGLYGLERGDGFSYSGVPVLVDEIKTKANAYFKLDNEVGSVVGFKRTDVKFLKFPPPFKKDSEDIKTVLYNE